MSTPPDPPTPPTPPTPTGTPDHHGPPPSPLPLSGSDLTDDPQLAEIDVGALVEVWRQAHFGAQAAAELGKAWAEEAADDSHSSFSWVESASFQGLEGCASADERGLRARLDMTQMKIAIASGAGAVLDELGLEGETVSGALAWVRERAGARLGPARQEARPAPDLPEHALGSGAVFGAVTSQHRTLTALYATTAEALTKLRSGALPLDAPSCWPHHFDLASLAVMGVDAEGAMARTVGVGVTPPDGVEASGYWYVGPWVRGGAGSSGEGERLRWGRWVDRGEGALPMAVLPVSEYAGASARTDVLATFLSEAIVRSLELVDA